MTRAQKLNIQTFPYYEYDEFDRLIYSESESGSWTKWEYRKYERHSEDSNAFWSKSTYDVNCNEIFYENSDGGWRETKYSIENYKLFEKNSRGQWYDYGYNQFGVMVAFTSFTGTWCNILFCDNNTQLILYEDYEGNYWTPNISEQCPFITKMVEMITID